MFALLCHCQSGPTPSPDCRNHTNYLEPQSSDISGLCYQLQVNAREHAVQFYFTSQVSPSARCRGWKRWSGAVAGHYSIRPALRLLGCGRDKYDTGSRVPWQPREHISALTAGSVTDRNPSLLCSKIFHWLFMKAKLLMITPRQWLIVTEILRQVYSWGLWDPWQAALAWLSFELHCRLT